MPNGGGIASRGFIFQAVVALIECLDPDNDWDQIKNEPNTDEDKVDIILYKDGKPRSAIQVKSSINDFERADVKGWLEILKSDAKDAENVCLYLVGDTFTPSCERFIEENRSEIKTVPFKNLQSLSTERLVEYIKSKGDWIFRNEDRKFINEALFAKLFTNSISKAPVSHEEFEEQFKRALPVHIIPKCLTPVPAVNRAVGLVGRDDIKKTVRDMLEENDRMALVNGLGGIGKTAVMQHICNDLKNKEKYVAWIECGGSLKEDLLLLRSALGIPESVKSDEAYKEIEKELKANRQLAGDLYLFLDNLSRKLSDEEQEVLNGLHIHVMATSRFEHDYFVNLPLDVLEETAALDMFYGYYLERQTDKTRRFIDAAVEIVGSVQNHTLLVELLAKAAAKKGGTLEDFRNNLKTLGVFDVFKRTLSTKHDRNRTIEKCVMELYKISELTPAQQHIMKLFTIFTPEKEIYYKVGEWAELDMDAMDELVDLGWIEQGGLENGYHIHQIIRDSITRQMEKDGAKVNLEDYGDFIDRVIDTDSYLGRTITYEIVRERIILTEDIARFFVKRGREDATTKELLNNMAGVFYMQGDYRKAMESFGKAYAIIERTLESHHPDKVTLLNNIAHVSLLLGDYEKAQNYFEKALTIKKSLQRTNNVSIMSHELGVITRAVGYHGCLIAHRPQVMEMDHTDLVAMYSNTAGIYYIKGDYKKALEYFEEALLICNQMKQARHPHMAILYNNMAAVFYAQGDYEKALSYYRNVLEIQEHTTGVDYPDIVVTYNNIASVYVVQGNYEEALDCYQRALVVQEKRMYTGHLDTAVTYNNMGRLFYLQCDYGKAMEYYQNALTIQKHMLGKAHPDEGITFNNIASVFYVQGDYTKALEQYQNALTIQERTLDVKHPDIATTFNNLALVFLAQGDYKKSLEYNGKALIIQYHKLGAYHPDTKTTLNNIATVLHMQRDYKKALDYLRNTLSTIELAMEKDCLSTAKLFNTIAMVYREQSDYIIALELFKKVLSIQKRVLGTDHPDTAITYNNIAEVYKSQGNYTMALEYFGKTQTIQERMLVVKTTLYERLINE